MSNPEALFAEAGRLAGAGQLADADTLYQRVLALLPDHPLVLGRLGLLRAHMGRDADAADLLRRAAQAQPDQLESWFNLGVVLRRLGQVPQAIAAYREVVARQPDHVDALVALGNAQAAAGQADAAVASFRHALRADAGCAPALAALARVLAAQGDLAGALPCCVQVAQLRPQSADAHFNLGTVLKRLGRRDDAADAFLRALAVSPHHTGALTNLGNLRKEQNRFDDAAALLEQVLQHAPQDEAALLNLGHVRQEQGRQTDALALFGRVLAQQPHNAHALFAQTMAQLPIVFEDQAQIAASRASYTGALQSLSATVQAAPAPAAYAPGIGASQPFYLPYQNQDDRALQTLYGDLLCRIMADRFPPAPLVARQSGRVRVGFVSGFFRDHSNWKIPVGGWMRALDRNRFAIFGYHTGTLQDSHTDDARALCDRFVQGPLPLDVWRREILHDAPDVLIYPEIGIDPIAVQLAAQRLARTQCNSWGQPVTSGMPSLDWFISSALMEPDDAQGFYTEKLLRLPGLSMAYDPPQTPPAMPDRARFGLRGDAVVYWCGQSLYKFLPQHDWVFPAIARQVGNCQFVFIRFRHGHHINAVFERRLHNSFAQAGLRAEDHVAMLPYLPNADFAASLASADIFLDSMGWSGCNTMLESLPYALPVVTTPGRFMRGRHGSAILAQLGLADRVAADDDAYLRRAVALGQDREQFAQDRQMILERRHRAYADPAPGAALQEFLIGLS